MKKMLIIAIIILLIVMTILIGYYYNISKDGLNNNDLNTNSLNSNELNSNNEKVVDIESHDIEYIDYNYSGDDIGSYERYTYKDNSLTIITCEGNGYDEDKTIYEVDDEKVKTLKTFILNSDYENWNNYEPEEIETLDAGTKSVLVRIDGKTYSVDNNVVIPNNFQGLISKVKDLLLDIKK